MPDEETPPGVDMPNQEILSTEELLQEDEKTKLEELKEEFKKENEELRKENEILIAKVEAFEMENKRSCEIALGCVRVLTGRFGNIVRQ